MTLHRKEKPNSMPQASNDSKQDVIKIVPIFVCPTIHSQSVTIRRSIHHSLLRRWSTVELDCFSSYLSVFKCSCLVNAFVTSWGIGMGWPYLWSSYSSLYCSIQVVILSPCSFSAYEIHSYCNKLHSWWVQDTHVIRLVCSFCNQIRLDVI